MNIPMSWLKEYVNIDADTKDFIEDITMSGSKVEAVEYMGSDIKNVVVGKITNIEKHPDADKLVVTQIDIGSETVQIVTGATNVREGQYVPVALHNAVLADGKVIKNSKLRGVDSQGMLCSIEELGHTKNDFPEAPEDGIYIFQNEYELGSNACVALDLVDDVVEYEITSNRADCNSVLGIAREAAATYNKPFNYPEIKLEEKAQGNINELVEVEIKNPELCPRYIARVIKNVKIGPSPQWLRHRLTFSGIRPVNNIVDITNYVMLEMGQPMHAFDIENIDDKKIIVRNAVEGETITTLDNIERKLDPSMLVIADANKAVAIAGVMGGENSMVTGNSGAILIESANFNGTNIRLTSKKIGLRTDASGKYEKGLDPNLSLDAVNRCVQLIELLGCGEVVKGMVDCYPNKRESKEVEFCYNNINKLLGTNISSEDMDHYFHMVGIEVKGNKAIIPTFRPDIEREADLAEEAARLYGYNNIATTLQTVNPTVGKRNRKQTIAKKIVSSMTGLGFSEIMNFTFESPKVFEKLNIPSDSALRNNVKINNPLGEDFSIMRTHTLNGMIQSISNNYNKRNDEALLFEMGKIYIPKSLPLTELPEEKEVLTVGLYEMKNKYDFYFLKGVIEEFFNSLGIKGAEYLPCEDFEHMHPYRTAKIVINNKEIGYMGEVHPEVCANYSIGAKAYICVLNTQDITENVNLDMEYKDLPKYPKITRDISMVVKDEIYVMDIEKAIREKAGKILENVKLFDVYKGGQIEENHKSVSYTLDFRASDRTLTDDDVQTQMTKILKNLEEKFNTSLRDK